MTTTADRVRETTNIIGTDTLTLLGAVPNFRAFGDVPEFLSEPVYYCIDDPQNQMWEVVEGTYDYGSNTLTRDVVLSSSNSGLLVDFIAGVKQVFATAPAAFLL